MKSASHHVPTWHKRHRDSFTTGEKLADWVASFMGSWKFIIIQSLFVVLWMVLNLVAYVEHWDPYPFILLNLLFSTQAAYAAPIIMMSQNRSAARDRHQALADYETNQKAETEIQDLQLTLSRIENEKLDRILALLEKK